MILTTYHHHLPFSVHRTGSADTGMDSPVADRILSVSAFADDDDGSHDPDGHSHCRFPGCVDLRETAGDTCFQLLVDACSSICYHLIPNDHSRCPSPWNCQNLVSLLTRLESKWMLVWTWTVLSNLALPVLAGDVVAELLADTWQCNLTARLPLGISDIAKTPLAGPSSVVPEHFVGWQTEEAGPEDAFVVPWQDMNTCKVSHDLSSLDPSYSHEITEQDLGV